MRCCGSEGSEGGEAMNTGWILRSRVPPVSHPLSSSPDEFFPGALILARNQQDGFYHQATVVHKVQSCRGLWVVQFCGSQQLLSALDMVQFDQSLLKHLRPGDTVLCPIRPDYCSHDAPGTEPGLQSGLGSQRFGPGRVISVTQESSDPLLRVLLWDSRLSLSHLSSLCPLPQNLFYRISRELLRVSCQSWAYNHGDGITCPSARLQSTHITCPSLSFPRELQRAQSSCQSSMCFCDDRITCPSFSYDGDLITCPPPAPCLCYCLQNPTRTKTALTGSEPGLKSGSGFRSDLDRTREEEKEEEKEEEEEEEEAEGREFKRKYQRRERPPWRYWRRTGPEPQHKKPGGAVSWRPPQFSYVTFPSPQSRSLTNHSAMFQPLANHTKGGGLFKYRPHPPENPASQRPRSAINHRPSSVI